MGKVTLSPSLTYRYMMTSTHNQPHPDNELEPVLEPSIACYLPNDVCRQARLSRDARFDGRFFIGVKTTGIYCRSICPASPPKEQNVVYFDSAIKASQAGLRPCLRCRPDSAPESNAWQGTSTSLQRAISLIEGGSLSGENAQSLTELSARLGISSRYLSRLFNQQLGTSPKKYALYRQLMFAKQLLHQTSLSITDVAMAAGFNSIRRFNEVFKSQLLLTPTQLRKTQKVNKSAETNSQGIKLLLDYRPPYSWQDIWSFYQLRAVDGMEWLNETTYAYGRSFAFSFNEQTVTGVYEVVPVKGKNQLALTVEFEQTEHIRYLHQTVRFIRQRLDLDADMDVIEQSFEPLQNLGMKVKQGLRIPGTASVFEAGCRAVLGQQVSVIQASKLLNILVKNYGAVKRVGGRDVQFFPSAESIAAASLDEFKMPESRKRALKGLGDFVAKNPFACPSKWIDIKGIGPWTIAYAQMRGESNPDVFLGGDLVIKNRIKALLLALNDLPDNNPFAIANKAEFTPRLYQTFVNNLAKQVSPWGSYLTFQLWSQNEN